jgi:hypothetical protein
LLEFIDLRFVTGDEGIDKDASLLCLRSEFEAMRGMFIEAFSEKILDSV